ncbi:unnamed protein product [Larinioides sclopetarius]|uniref:Uncharacterized protein n=1 Tax=Larinioides sclopetarius TaxID=280406 RepID=A0AAV2AJJ1_9ARAC
MKYDLETGEATVTIVFDSDLYSKKLFPQHKHLHLGGSNCGGGSSDTPDSLSPGDCPTPTDSELSYTSSPNTIHLADALVDKLFDPFRVTCNNKLRQMTYCVANFWRWSRNICNPYYQPTWFISRISVD